VHAGEVLVRLDDADLKAKLEQAEAAAASAEAAYAQAENDEKRVGRRVQKNGSKKASEKQRFCGGTPKGKCPDPKPNVKPIWR